MSSMYYCYYTAPFGELLLTGSKTSLFSVHFPANHKRKSPPENFSLDKKAFLNALDQLDAYFEGSLKRFDLNLTPHGTDFQKKVWKALLRIEYGKTAAYSEIAEMIGNPKASRAVGMANSKNPIPIIIPCHRIIGKNGSLTGFGGGLKIKQFLLDLENHGR